MTYDMGNMCERLVNRSRVLNDQNDVELAVYYSKKDLRHLRWKDAFKQSSTFVISSLEYFNLDMEA